MFEQQTNTAQTVVTDRQVAGSAPDSGGGGGGTAFGWVPLGGIIMYSGAFADLPANWHLCDGDEGTPDLTDRFILGTNTEAELGDVGGTAQHKHAVGTLANALTSGGTPAGTLDSVSAGTPAGTVNVSGSTANDTAVTGAAARVTAVPTATFSGSALAGHVHTFTGSALAGHTHTISGKTADAEDGGGLTTDVLPPWYKLAFIQRIA